MQVYLSFDKVFEEIQLQLRGDFCLGEGDKLGSGGGSFSIANYDLLVDFFFIFVHWI